MTNGAEGFSFAKRRGDNSFRIFHLVSLPTGCRLGCMGVAFLLLWDLLNSSVLLDMHGWAWTYLIAPILIIVGISDGLFVNYLDVDTQHHVYVHAQGYWPLPWRHSGDIRDLRFVCIEQFEKWETRGGTRHTPPRKQRVVGAKAYIGLPGKVEGRDEEFIFAQFSRDVPSDGRFDEVFPWDLYGSLVDEVSAFAQLLQVDFKQVGKSAPDSKSTSADREKRAEVILAEQEKGVTRIPELTEKAPALAGSTAPVGNEVSGQKKDVDRDKSVTADDFLARAFDELIVGLVWMWITCFLVASTMKVGWPAMLFDLNVIVVSPVWLLMTVLLIKYIKTES